MNKTYKNDLKDKLSKLLDIDIDYPKDYDLEDDLILWGEKLKDDDGIFIHGELVMLCLVLLMIKMMT